MKEELLRLFVKVSNEYIGNSNSLHKLGLNSKKLENASIKLIIDTLNLKNKEIIFTSNGNESDTLIVYGILKKYRDKYALFDNNISDSLLISLNKLNISITKDITKDIVLTDNISIGGYKYLYIDNKEKLNTNLNDYNFVTIDLSNVMGIKGISAVIKDKNIVFNPLIHGGKSTTIYRSGTPALPFIVIFAKAIKILTENKIIM